MGVFVGIHDQRASAGGSRLRVMRVRVLGGLSVEPEDDTPMVLWLTAAAAGATTPVFAPLSSTCRIYLLVTPLLIASITHLSVPNDTIFVASGE